MKKLLVSMLILGFTTIAQAMPTWSLTADGIHVYVNVTTPDARKLYLALAVNPADGSLSNFAKGTEAPGNSASWGTLESVGLGSLGQGDLWDMVDTVYSDGVWLVANWALQSGKTSALVTVYEVDETRASTELANIIVPEPTTIALLGLGGLLMLRRRK